MQPSKVYTVQEVVDFLRKLGYPALPVAPKQDPYKYPLRIKDQNTGEWKTVYEKDGVTPKPQYTGKNPSYLDKKGIPHLINHRKYQDRPPTIHEHNIWFQNPQNGVGTLGGWNDTIWIDLDVKNFNSQVELDFRFTQLLENFPELKNSWRECTHSGGYRLAVKPKEKPDCTNFSLDGVGGKHHGEALGPGRFTVLAPTIGVSGNPYVCLNRALSVEIESLEAIGIYPVSEKEKKSKTITKKEKAETNTPFGQDNNAYPQSLEVQQLLSVSAKQVLAGFDIKDDESFSLAVLIYEITGWMNWLSKQNIGIADDPYQLIVEAGRSLGKDDDHIDRIIDSVDTLNSHPAIWSKQGDAGCWLKVKNHSKEIFEKACPNVTEIQEYQWDANIEKFKGFRKLKDSIKQNNRYLELHELPEQGYLIAIKSFMSSGKTYTLLKRLSERYKQDELGFFWIAHRIKLIHQSNNKARKKFGLPSILLNDADIQENVGVSLVNDVNQCIFLCGESFSKIEPNTQGRDLIIDEVCSVISQLNSGGTVSGAKQALTLKAFESAAIKCRNLIVMDANLSQDELNLLAAISGKKLLIIENEAKPEKSIIQFLKSIEINEEGLEGDEDSKDKSAVSKRILNSKLPFVVSDSSRFLIGALEALFKGKFGFTLCQDTSNETWLELEARRPGSISYFKPKDTSKKWADEFLEDPDIFIENYKPQYLFLSPTAESGVSIEIRGYFTEKFLVSSGVLSLNNLSQMLFRLRDNSIPTFVCMPDVGLYENDRDYFLGANEISLQERQERHQLVSQAHAEDDLEAVQRLRVTELAYSRLSMLWDEYGRAMALRDRLERMNYKAYFKVLLSDMGHEIIDTEDEISEALQVTLIKNKEAYLEDKAKREFDAPTIPYDEADKNYQKNPTVQNALIKAKAKILNLLPDIDKSDVWSPEFILLTLTDRDYRNRHDYYYLFKNPDILKDWANYQGYKKLTSQFVSNHYLGNKKVEVVTGLIKLGLPNLIQYLEEGNEINKDNEIIKKIVDAGRSKQIKLLLGFEPGKKSVDGKDRMQYIQKLLDTVGLKFAKPQQKLDCDGVKKRHYKLDKECFNGKARKAILESLTKYYDNWKSEKFSKPDWEFSANNNGQKAPNFQDEDDRNLPIIENVPRAIEETSMDFNHNGEYISYTFPDLTTIKIAGQYYKAQYDLISMDSISGTPEALQKALQLLEDMEIYPLVKSSIMEAYSVDFDLFPDF